MKLEPNMMSAMKQISGGLVGIVALLLLSGCNTPTAAVESASQQQEENNPAETAESQSALEASNTNIIQRPSTVSQKGTNIRAVVNGEPITNYDIQRRAAFLALRRVGGNRNEKALEELVEEKIKIQEARKQNTVASNREVDESYANFAQSNRMTPSQLSGILNQSGVTADHFKEYVRGQISWNRATGGKLREEIVSRTTQDTMHSLREAGGEKPSTYEYLLEQVIFVIPDNQRKARLKQRMTEAEAFRQRFTRCGETKTLAVGQLDVTIRTLPRSLEPELPPVWKDELIKTPEGGTTGIKETERGVEFIAVCSRKTVSDDRVAQVMEREQKFEEFNKRGDELSEEFLAELKSKSKIIYR